MNPNLIAAAQQGRTDLLYAEIECHPYVLDDIDKIPFVETPLHLAASVGQVSFATEIMRLKPLFAQKLNPQGLSPMHLALKNSHYMMVHRFICINKELIRVKGKDGITPFHMVSQAGEIDLLAEFLSVCPKSIQDVTIQNQNPLHIAVKSRQFGVLDFLVRWLQCNCDTDAESLQNSTLNCRDEAGNTVLHMLVGLDDPDPKIVKLLLRCKIDVNAKNLNQLTALDILERHNQGLNEHMENILFCSGALRAASLTSTTLVDSLPNNITFLEELTIEFFRHGANITDSNRNALLAAAALVVTMTFQASLSPPGGLFHKKGSLIHNSTDSAMEKYAGKSIMDADSFFCFWILNTVAMVYSIVVIFILLPSRGLYMTLLQWTPVIYFGVIYFLSMDVITPNSGANSIQVPSILLLICFVTAVGAVSLIRVKRYCRKSWEIKSRFSLEEN